MNQLKIFVACLCLIFGGLFSACSIGSNSTKALAEFDDLFYVSKEKDGKTTKGFMDKTGKIILGPWDSFEWNGKKYGADEKSEFKVMPFIGGMAGICFNEDKEYRDKAKCGFMDKTGKVVIEPKYMRISYFSEGLAAVAEDGRKFGYVDKTGRQVIEQKFNTAEPFSEGLAAAGEESFKYGYIDKTGKYVIEPIFEPKFAAVGSFVEGHTIVLSGDQQIIIDKSGKQVATIKYGVSTNSHFDTFLRPFYKADGEYVNVNTFPKFNEGLTTHTQSDEVGFMNTDGTIEIKLDRNSFEQVRPFSNGVGPAKWNKDEEWTYVDRTGKTIISRGEGYATARPFVEKKAAVRRKGDDDENQRWGFVDLKENKIFATTFYCFEKVSDFHGGLAFVKIYAPMTEQCKNQYKGAFEQGTTYIDVAGNQVEPKW